MQKMGWAASWLEWNIYSLENTGAGVEYLQENMGAVVKYLQGEK